MYFSKFLRRVIKINHSNSVLTFFIFFTTFLCYLPLKSQGQSAVIDFNSQPFIDNTDFGSTIYEEGNYRLTYSAGNWFEDASNGNSNTNGLAAFFFSGVETITIETIDGSEFRLDSFYLNEFNFGTGVSQIEGFKDGSSTGMDATGFNTTGVHVPNNNLNNVDRVILTSGASGFFATFDDLTFADPILDPQPSEPFITTWSIPAEDLELTLPLEGTDFSINWGDGTIEAGLSSTGLPGTVNDFSHIYSLSGSYTVEVSVGLKKIVMSVSDDSSDLQTIDQWGDIAWTSMINAFRDCSAMALVATDFPDLSLVLTMQGMFAGASSFNQPIGDWDVSSVTDMSNLFFGANSFNQNISGWDVSNVTDMSGMFREAFDFNQSLNSWNVSSVERMSAMFRNASSFNQDLNNWDVSGVTDMGNMFLTATNFNGDITDWDVSNVAIMGSMFRNARAFNQPIGSWQTINMTNMGRIFDGADSFNQDIGSWDVSSVTNFQFVLSAESFNQDVSAWDVSNAIQMSNMFFDARVFNQPLDNWDVSNVTDMTGMFNNAFDFNQSLGDWNVSQVENMTDMLRNSGLSIESYDNTLIGWASLPSLQSNVPLGAQGLEYCLGAAARQLLVDTYNWNITGDQSACSITFTSVSEVSFAENEVGVVIDANANIGGADDQGITYSLAAGDDSDLCLIDSSTGEITFIVSPDFENPLDDDSDNIYNIEVIASSAGTSTNQQISITVTDVAENSAPEFTSTPVTSVNDNEIYNYAITTADVDGDYITITATTVPNWLNLVGITGSNTTTFAGSGAAGFINGTGTSAVFNFPAGVAVDAVGNVYVADQDNHVIRKITPAGVVSTFCGSGIQGFADGSASVARFDNPKDLAFDSQGNLYVADFENNRIRKVAPDGNVTTLAGSGAAGFVNGNGTSAVFNFPAGVAVDAADNVYVADQDNYRIRKITPTGDVTTFAGSGIEGFADGTSSIARFDDPKDLSFDKSGNLYVADHDNHRIRKIIPDGTVSTLAGSGAAGYVDGQGTNAVFNFPAGVAVDPQGNICVADQDNQRIRVITPSGTVSTFVGSGIEGFADGDATTVRFDDLKDLAFDAAGNLYVADFQNNRIRKLAGTSYVLTGDPSGQPVGDYPVVLEANDGNGGTTTQNFIVTIIDNTAPELTTQNISVGNDEGICGAVVNNFGVSATDNSGSVNLTFDIPEGTLFDVGTTTVTATAVDPSGNSTIASFDVTVTDTEAPVIALNGSTTINLELGELYIEPGAFASDNCSISSGVIIGGDFVNTNVADTYTVTYNKIDAAGNSALELTRTVIVSASFITTWFIPSNDLSLELPLEGVNFSIDWGDGSVDTGLSSGTISHQYATQGDYQVKISPSVERIIMGLSEDADDLRSVDQWGDAVWSSMNSAFKNCTGVALHATDIPDLSQVTDMSSMFSRASPLGGNLNSWDVSNVTLMNSTFNENQEFNQPLNNWDVSNVISMDSTFRGALSFNQPLNSWDVSNVTSMRGLFDNAISFNQPLDNWDVGSVTSMAMMFDDAFAFNQPLNNWDVSNVTSMERMFFRASSFDQPLDNWDVSNTTIMHGMFWFAGVFNQPLNAWDVGNVNTMENMFSGATSFNQPLNSWDISNVTTINNMFRSAVFFNQGLSNWNVNNVNSMNGAFENATSFNQPLDNWDVGNVTSMSRMFFGASSFDQSLGNWNVGGVTNMTGILDNTLLSVDNYDHTLIGWSNLPSLQEDLTVGVEGLSYCGGAIARQLLIDNYNWDFQGDERRCLLVITSPASALFAENGTGVVLDVNANVGGDDDDGVSYSISGDDASLFTIDSNNGQLNFINSPDFENPLDSGTDNIYNLKVTASDGVSSIDQALSVTVTDVDEAPPVIIVNDITASNDDGLCGAIVEDFGASTTDNSGSVTLTFDISEGTLFNIGTTIVTATATDASGNQSQATFNVTVIDNIAPIAKATNITVSLGADGTVTVDPEMVDDGSTDNTNCPLTFTLSQTIFDCSDIGKGSYYYDDHDCEDDRHRNKKGKGHYSYRGYGYGHYKHKKGKKHKGHKVILTVTDAAGNSSTTSAYVEVVDNVAPVIDQGPVDLVVYDEVKTYKKKVRKGRRWKWVTFTKTEKHYEYLKDEDVEPLVSDNCQLKSFYFHKTRYSTGDVGINQVQVTAWDKYGNRSSGAIQVNVVDITNLGKYVDMCYGGWSITVKQNKVQDMLRRGATLGDCNVNSNTNMSASPFTLGQSAEQELFVPELKLESYPNPTSGITTIRIRSSVSGPARVALVSTSGIELEELYSAELEANTEVEVGYDASPLPSGVYIVRLVTAGEVRNLKLMVKK